MDNTRVRCTDCGWQGRGHQLQAQACPICDGRVGEEGSLAYEMAEPAATMRAALEVLAREDLQPLIYTGPRCELCGEPAGAGAASCPACRVSR